MPLFIGTQQQYYTNTLTFNGDGSATAFDLNTDANGAGFDPLPATIADFNVFFDGVEQSSALYDATPYNAATGILTFDSAPANGVVITITQISVAEAFGGYQYITLQDAVNNFLFSYVGEGKIITKLKRADVLFHAQRCLQELSYDTLRSSKSQEIEVPPSLQVALPHDYVNYTKICYSDTEGVERILLPARKTSNPKSILQDGNYDYLFNNDGTLLESAESDTWAKYQANSGVSQDDSDIKYDSDDFDTAEGRRYGLEPEYAQTNGVFYIDNYRGRIHFSNTMSQKTVVIHYISDGVGTEEEKLIHKFAEEALYKWIAHAVLSVRQNIPEYVIQRFKKERYAAIRQAKLRLSNLKSEELAQVMRGKSKIIKH